MRCISFVLNILPPQKIFKEWEFILIKNLKSRFNFRGVGTRNEHSTPLERIKVIGKKGRKELRYWLRVHKPGKGRALDREGAK